MKVVLVKTHRKKDFKGPVYDTQPTIDPEDYEIIRVENVSKLKPGDIIGSREIISVRKMKEPEFVKMLGIELARRNPLF